jgi:DNA-binding NarL/FixJ family response regulator
VSIRIILVDDQELVRTGFRMVLEAQPDMTVVGEAADGLGAVEMARRHPADVVVMDVRMPRLDGAEATRRICAAGDQPRVLMLTTFDLDEYAFAGLKAGASGFLLKDVPPAELLFAISRAPHNSATASITCSQLSSTSSSCWRAKTAVSESATGTPGRSGMPSSAATADGTRSGSLTAASSATHTPSANRAAVLRATSPASRVLPTPPGPVTVTSRRSASKPETSSTAVTRPTKLVSAENPCTPVTAPPTVTL